ncbi:7419_t:CDS:2, partial [Racocetra fulgida]
FLQQVDIEEKAEGKILEQLNNFKAEAINVKHIPHLSSIQFLIFGIQKVGIDTSIIINTSAYNDAN